MLITKLFTSCNAPFTPTWIHIVCILLQCTYQSPIPRINNQVSGCFIENQRYISFQFHFDFSMCVCECMFFPAQCIGLRSNVGDSERSRVMVWCGNSCGTYIWYWLDLFALWSEYRYLSSLLDYNCVNVVSINGMSNETIECKSEPQARMHGLMLNIYFHTSELKLMHSYEIAMLCKIHVTPPFYYVFYINLFLQKIKIKINKYYSGAAVDFDWARFHLLWCICIFNI